MRVILTMVLLCCVALPVRAQDLPDYVIAQYGAPPASPDGPLSQGVSAALEVVTAHSLAQSDWRPSDRRALDLLAASGDPRVVWALVDMMRFTWRPEFSDALTDTGAAILGIELVTPRHRAEITDTLIAWDVPAYPGYLAQKRAVYTHYVKGWERLFVPGDLDWHLVSWGGVNIDARPYGETDQVCDCIPAADNPQVTRAADAVWLKDDDIVFGIALNGEARAYPRRIMEVREMVNDTLGGRDLGIPYCTLCGAAQAYFTDNLPLGVKRPVLRTSGLLIRSNKVMFDLETFSIFDTFRGHAVTGPLSERDVQLEPVTIVTTDWGAWKAAHPNTTVLVEDLALGRDYDLRNTRDARGPIFPIGDVDPRLEVHDEVLGVLSPDGTPVAFERGAARAALTLGQRVEAQGVRVVSEAGGLRAVTADGTDLASHEAFWFAWSQFHPATTLWPAEGR